MLGGAFALLTLAACSDSSPPPAKGAPDVGRDDPDRPIVDTVRTEKLALIREYDLALLQVPTLAKELAPLRAAHVTHLEKLGPPAATPSPTSVSGSGQTKAELLRGLAAAEKAAAAKRISQCRELRSGAVARLVAAIGGSEAAHASVLRDLAGGES